MLFFFAQYFGLGELVKQIVLGHIQAAGLYCSLPRHSCATKAETSPSRSVQHLPSRCVRRVHFEMISRLKADSSRAKGERAPSPTGRED